MIILFPNFLLVNRPTVVLVRVRASSMMVETPKSPDKSAQRVYRFKYHFFFFLNTIPYWYLISWVFYFTFFAIVKKCENKDP